MKLKLAAMLAMLLAAPLVAQEQTQALWDRTRVGMSRQQVQALYPAAVPDAPGNDVEATGAQCLIRLDDALIAEEHYSVNFCFRDGRLISVAFGTVDSARETRFRQRHDRLLAYLRGGHGEPTRVIRGGDLPEGVMAYAWEEGCFSLYVITASSDGERGMLAASYNGADCPGSRAG